ncbi:hypothetical protein GX48_08162 [Paracoccidioides brasiliensis]|nr:hypothetical protein GX48_08162 [Paracoccidioides brasiliensis]
MAVEEEEQDTLGGGGVQRWLIPDVQKARKRKSGRHDTSYMVTRDLANSTSSLPPQVPQQRYIALHSMHPS